MLPSSSESSALRTLRRANSLRKNFSAVADDVRRVLTQILANGPVEPILRQTVLEAALWLSQTRNGFDVQLIASLALAFWSTNQSIFSKIVQDALENSSSLRQDLRRTFIPLCERSLEDITSESPKEEAIEDLSDFATIFHAFVQSSADIAIIFGHSERFIFALCKVYNLDIWDSESQLSIRTKAQLLEATYTSLDAAYFSRLDGITRETSVVETCHVLQRLLEIPSSSSSSLPPTSLVNLSLVADLEHVYRISNRLTSQISPKLEPVRTALRSRVAKGRVFTGLLEKVSSAGRRTKGKERAVDTMASRFRIFQSFLRYYIAYDVHL
jgi:hypothetical protein